MKRVAIIILLSVLACGKAKQTATVQQLWTTSPVLTTSESVLFNPEDSLLYVSCINGQPTEKDGNGFIARVNLKGEIVDSAWATGLNAPKGSGILGDRLYVTDIDALVEIDLNSGEVLQRYAVEGARFLNDVTVSKDGIVYFSDSSEENSVIYTFQEGQVEEWLKSEDIASPNGILLEDNTLYVGSFKSGDLFAVNTDTRAIERVGSVGFGIDGLKRTADGAFLVSDWVGQTAIFTPGKPLQMLLDTRDKKINSADIEYIADQNMMFVPTFFDNRVAAYRLKTE